MRTPDREKQNEIEKLRREHGKLDGQLQELECRKFLTAEDEAEVRRLKKLKLAKKDALRQLQPEA